MTSKTAINTSTNNRQEIFSTSIAQKNENLSDNELVILVRESQSELFSQIVDRYQRKLYAYFFRVERNKEEVEDLVQDVFLKVFKNLHSYDSSREFSPWIFSIARNTAINHVRHESLKQFISIEAIAESESKPEFPSLEENPDQLCVRKETSEEVDEAIKKLPEKYKQVLILRYYYDKSYQEIAKTLGKSMNTVGTLIRRAKNKVLVQINEASGQMTTLETRYLLK